MRCRRVGLALLFILTTLFAPLVAEAQQVRSVYRIGAIDLAGSGPTSNALLQGLKALGWVEGQNFVFERRLVSSPTSIEQAATELVELKVDLIIVRSTGLRNRCNGRQERSRLSSWPPVNSNRPV
jgi:hypothetical protein